jgi:hypothetical protein
MNRISLRVSEKRPVVVLYGLLMGTVFLTGHVGCQHHATTDSDYCRNQTIASLKEWGNSIEFVLVNGLDDPLRYKSCEEVLAAWGKKGLIPAGSAQNMRQDAWGKRFTWSASKDERGTVVIVSSTGEDETVLRGRLLSVVVIFSNGRADVRIDTGK